MRSGFDIKKEAESLAESNVQAEPNISEILLFPDDEEIRLVEIDSTMPPSDEISPYYFPPDPLRELHFRSAIALINPEDKGRPLPSNWGAWKDAIRLYPKEH